MWQCERCLQKTMVTRQTRSQVKRQTNVSANTEPCWNGLDSQRQHSQHRLRRTLRKNYIDSDEDQDDDPTKNHNGNGRGNHSPNKGTQKVVDADGDYHSPEESSDPSYDGSDSSY